MYDAKKNGRKTAQNTKSQLIPLKTFIVTICLKKIKLCTKH